MQKNNKNILAHRGFSNIAPENTFLSFEAAYLFGFDGVELDVHLTKDNEMVVIHDETIDRTSDGKGFVKDMTLEEIKTYNFAYKFNPFFPSQKIMTYKEFLKEFGNKFKVINVEIKTDQIHYKDIEKLIYEETKRSNVKAQIVYSSFNIESLKILNKINKDLELGFLFDDYDIIKKEKNVVKEICKYIHPKYTSLLEKEKLDFYNDLGLHINTWTLDYSKNKEDSLEEFKKLLQIENLVSIIGNTKF